MTPLTDTTRAIVDTIFAEADRAQALELLETDCGNNLAGCGKFDSEQIEHIRFAALKASRGDLGSLLEAIVLAQTDYRDLLMEAGFGFDPLQVRNRWVWRVLSRNAAGTDTTELTEAVRTVAGRLFSRAKLARTLEMLEDACGSDLPFCRDKTPEQMERIRFAALKLSNGDTARLCSAIFLARTDWRELLMEAGFGNDLQAHEEWARNLADDDGRGEAVENRGLKP